MGKRHLLQAAMFASIASMTATGAVRGNEFRGDGDRDRDDRNQHCDPRSYGAVNDGKTDNTLAIQTAIDRCAARGGGIVPITGGGVFVTGPIELKSRILLKITAPTVLKNTTDHSRYQPAFIGYPFRFANDPAVTGTGPTLPGKPEAMISANDVVDAGIIGDGTIDGSGNDVAAAATPDNPGALSWWQLAANGLSRRDEVLGLPDRGGRLTTSTAVPGARPYPAGVVTIRAGPSAPPARAQSAATARPPAARPARSPDGRRARRRRRAGRPAAGGRRRPRRQHEPGAATTEGMAPDGFPRTRHRHRSEQIHPHRRSLGGITQRYGRSLDSAAAHDHEPPGGQHVAFPTSSTTRPDGRADRSGGRHGLPAARCGSGVAGRCTRRAPGRAGRHAAGPRQPQGVQRLRRGHRRCRQRLHRLDREQCLERLRQPHRLPVYAATGGDLGFGGVQHVDSLGIASAEGLRVLATRSGHVTLLWYHQKAGTSPAVGEIADSTSDAGGPLTAATDVASAPGEGELLDAELGPGGTIWTVAYAGLPAKSVLVHPGLSSSAQTVDCLEPVVRPARVRRHSRS